MNLIFSELASRELVRTARDYESKAPGLGGLFLTEVEAATEQIQRFPESAPVFGARLRRKILNRFPYAVLYATAAEVIRIVAIMHQHRGPDFIARRLRIEGSHGDDT
jgi:plasmid stabilization system protein ParE